MDHFHRGLGVLQEDLLTVAGHPIVPAGMASPTDVTTACAVLWRVLQAEDADVVRAGDPHFVGARFSNTATATRLMHFLRPTATAASIASAHSRAAGNSSSGKTTATGRLLRPLLLAAVSLVAVFGRGAYSVTDRFVTANNAVAQFVPPAAASGGSSEAGAGMSAAPQPCDPAAINKAVLTVMPTLPFYSSSDVAKGGKPPSDPGHFSYWVSSADGSGIHPLAVGTPGAKEFVLTTTVRTICPPLPNAQEEQKHYNDNIVAAGLCNGDQPKVENAVGPFSCLNSSTSPRGSWYLTSGETRDGQGLGGAGAGVVVPCADISVYSAVTLAPAAPGAPATPPAAGLLQSLRQEAAQYTQDATTKLRDAVAPLCAAAPAIPASLSAGVACDQRDLSIKGEATCAASVTGQGPNPSLTYAWTVDGQPQSGTAATIPLRLSGGKQMVGVRVRDTRTNQVADAPPVTLTRGAVTGRGTGGSGTSPLPYVVGGGALAAAAALATLLTYHRGRTNRAFPAGAPAPAWTSPPANLPPPSSVPIGPAALSNPNGGDPGNRDRSNRPEPRVQAHLSVQTSVRTRDVVSTVGPQIWGDSVDVAFAGYTIDVSPPDWTVDDSSLIATLSVDGGTSTEVGSFPHFAAQGLGAQFRSPTSDRRWVVQSDWHPDNGWLTLVLSVTVTVSNAAGDTRSFIVKDSALVGVIGANPSLQLFPNGDGDADGTYMVRIDPQLTLFNTVYAGGLAGFLDPTRTWELDPYFDANFADYGPQTAFYQQSLSLRCKFHLADSDIQCVVTNGASVTFSVKPTGVGVGQDVLQGDFDWMVAEHYAACQQKLSYLYPAQSAVVQLRPSLINFGPPAPAALPAPSADPSRLFVARVRASVSSASGSPVSGAAIRRDRRKLTAGIIPQIGD